MKRFLNIVVTLLMIAAPLTMEGARSWDAVKTEQSDLKSIAKDTDIEIKVGNGHLYVIASRQVQIKIFSILGQLISSETLPPGTHRLTGTPHGVYIIKSGDLTCKVIL